MVVICVHLLHVNTISISPAFGTCRLHVDPASSLRLQSARGQFCTLANWCQWPTALLAATLAQRLPKATPPEGQTAIMTIPLEVVLTCQKTLARKQTCVTFLMDHSWWLIPMVLLARTPSFGGTWWNTDFHRMLAIWCCGIPCTSPHFHWISTELPASVLSHCPLFWTVLG